MNVILLHDLWVIKRIRQLLQKWYGIDLLIVDEKGLISSTSTGDQGYLLTLLQRTPLFKTYLEDFYKKEKFEIDPFVIKPLFPGLDCYMAKIQYEKEKLGGMILLPILNHGLDSQSVKEVFPEIEKFSIGYYDPEILIQEMMRNKHKQEREKILDLANLCMSEILVYWGQVDRRENKIAQLTQIIAQTHSLKNHENFFQDWTSSSMKSFSSQIQKAIHYKGPILLYGGKGVGKETYAKYIHQDRQKKDSLFISVEVPENYTLEFERELFTQYMDCTIYLKNTHLIPPWAQTKFIRYLLEGSYLEEGSGVVYQNTIVFIFGTTEHPSVLFPPFANLTYSIHVPSLQEREQDIKYLWQFLSSHFAKERNIPIKKVEARTWDILLEYTWPFNIHEMKEFIEEIYKEENTDISIIKNENLPSRIFKKKMEDISSVPLMNVRGALKDILEEIEKNVISQGLIRCNYNKSKLAKELEISRVSLLSKIEKYQLEKRRPGS